MFSEGGALAWSVDHDTWGTVRHVGSRPVERGDYWIETVAHDLNEVRPESAAQLCPIRFQGQWEDPESGLYYNRFRYYEPLAGQYVSPDPIGVLGGTRSTAYVANPGKYFDVFGLQAWRTMGSGICILQKFPAGSAAAEELASFVGLWNNEIIARGGRMTAGPLTSLQERISSRWKRDFRKDTCCGTGQVADYVPDAAGGGLPNPSNGGMLQMAETNSYLGGITGDMARKKASYTHVCLRDEC